MNWEGSVFGGMAEGVQEVVHGWSCVLHAWVGRLLALHLT